MSKRKKQEILAGKQERKKSERDGVPGVGVAMESSNGTGFCCPVYRMTFKSFSS